MIGFFRGQEKLLKKAKEIIEKKRGAKGLFWKMLVAAKDFFWKITTFEWEKIPSVVIEVFNANPENKIKYALLRLKYYRIPLWEGIQIELHSHCNRDCAWCPRYLDRSGIRKDSNGKSVQKIMPTEKVYEIIDQASRLGFTGTIGFHRLSEPLLDKRFIEIVRYAKQKGMSLVEATNGDPLRTNPALCAALDESGNRLTIGLYDCDTNEKRQSEREYWKKMFTKAEIVFSEPLHHNLYLRQNAQIFDVVEKDPLQLDLPCRAGEIRFRIRYDGNVSMCCQDDQCTFSIGNVFEQTLEEIWWSDKRIKITDILARPGGKRQFKLCKECFEMQELDDIASVAKWIRDHS